ncbi:DUF2231 domain-containing protein [Micromonospora sp. HM5-17]|uniref:DUF2231 domain-containing protein n=1 Tax=Micromonospora sp. HM5-17 TaxID=2487710 RepID=UPI000F47EFE8|nr:DUF2231 domain-containing protein [Micromonospora sp. HM5-17]ROT32550.1 hypothetical protein EF879_10370 [Micromonospora sp. HM5-17]
MFREVMGLPAHALLVHAAVVFVPLLALVGTGYAVLPRFRGRLDWAAASLAVVAPVAAILARLSGDELRDVLIAKNYPDEIIQQVDNHQAYGYLTVWWSVALGVATLALLVLTSRRVRSAPRWLPPLLGAVVVVLAVVNLWYVYRTGDTGATVVWQGVL